MSKNDQQSEQTSLLRRQAEDIALRKAVLPRENLRTILPEESLRMLHELEVHKIELEMQKEGLRLAQSELEAARDRYFNIYDLAPVGYCTISGQGLILEANLHAATLLGVDRGELNRQLFSRFILTKDQDIYYLYWKQLFETRKPDTCNLRMIKMDGTVFWAQLTATAAEDSGGERVCRLALSDITERKLHEEAQELTSSLTVLANTPGDMHQLMADFTALLQNWSRCEAVGIRLRVGYDYPYYETHGFPTEFVHEENQLCAYGPDGKILRDGEGNPVLDCMCGNILCGRFDPTKPFFSAHGSFWSNNTSALLTNTNEADRQARTRNRCNGEGYESVALIPLRAGNQVFGLLQFNDHRSDRFTAKMIAYLERIADSLAIALSRRQAEEALQQSRDLLAATEQISKVGGWEWNVAQQTMMWTDEVFRVHGFLPAEVQPGSPEILGRSLACYDPEDRPVVEAAFRRCVEEGEPYNLEFPFTTADGLRLWIQITARPVLEGGRVVKVLGNIMDITERKRVEASLQASLAEKEVLLREVHHRVKNNLASIIGLLDLQKVKITDEAASASLKNLGDRIMSMALVHESLYRSEDMTRIDFQGYINELTSHLQHSYGVQSHIRCSVEATEMKIGLDTAIPIGLIINELVTNAMKHAFPRGEPRPGSEGCEILITMQQDEDTYTLTVEDNGVGLPPDFDWRSCSSLGLRLVRMLGEHQLGGQSRFDQAEGTRFVLRFKDRWRQHSGS